MLLFQEFDLIYTHLNHSSIFLPKYIRVIEFLRNFEFRNWHAMRGELMLPDSISEEKLEIDWKMKDLQAWAVLVQAVLGS